MTAKEHSPPWELWSKQGLLDLVCGNEDASRFLVDSAPDMSGQNAAALQQAQLSKEQLDWAKSIYAETAPDRANTIARANAVSDAQLEAQKKQTALTDDYAKYNKETFRPLEQSIVADAAGYDTTERREAAAAKAEADVQTSFDNAQGQQQRNLDRRGVNPSSGATLAMGNQLAIQKATGLAGAANTARTQVETIGAARKSDAANLGRGLASAQATSAGIALTAGNSSVGNAKVAGDVTAQGNQIMNSGYSGAQAGLAGAASTYAGITNAEMKGNDNSAAMGALGSVAGAFVGGPMGAAAGKAMFSSDKNIKKDIKPVSGEVSLAALRKMPVKSWKYKKGSVGDDGGKTHTGPMAQNVRKGLGDVTAPGGKKIDLISMSGHQTSAIQELDKRLIRLENARKLY